MSSIFVFSNCSSINAVEIETEAAADGRKYGEKIADEKEDVNRLVL